MEKGRVQGRNLSPLLCFFLSCCRKPGFQWKQAIIWNVRSRIRIS